MSLELEARFVKTGLWTNLDKGPILGKTITTDTRTGNLVVALLAILSTLGTAHLWHLLAFAVYQIRANGRPADALFRQQQTLLRTLPTPSSVMADSLKLWWVWRKRTDRPFLRSIFLVLLALLFTTVTIAASVFSSLIVDSGAIEVLVDSPLCGRVSDKGRSWQSYKIALDQAVPPYARDCWKNGPLPSTCNVFVRPNVPLSVQDAPCPFNATMCDPKHVFSIDSGLVDVAGTFGINLAAKDRMRYRRKTTCTLLPLKGHTSIHNMTDLPPEQLPPRKLIPGEQIVALDYGPLDIGFTKTAIASLLLSNTSYSPGFSTGYHFHNNTKPNMWVPYDELINPEGDTLWKFFMGTLIQYENPIDDPLFSAHRAVVTYVDFVGNKTLYMSDDPVKVIGCLQQYQYCHTRNGKEDFCTPLRGIPDFILDESFFPEANELQRTVMQLLTFSDYIFDFASATTCKANALIQRDKKTIHSLPDDYWKQELTGHEKETWAALQILVAQYAIGPKASDPLADNYWIRPETDAEKTLCQAQKMKKSGDFVNINAFGLYFVIAFSILVALLDITLLKFLIYLSRFRRALAPRIDRWIQDGVWQLQRRAYEGEGYRDWVNRENEIPLTDKGQKLKDLPIMWLPGKSPAMQGAPTFSSTNSLGSQRPLRDAESVQDDEVASVRAKRGLGALRFWRR